MKKLLALIAVTLALSACGTTKALNFSEISAPLAKGQARIVVTRDTSLLFIGAGAPVEVNGQKIGIFGRGGSAVHDFPAGKTNVTVRTTLSPGQFVVLFDAKPGKTYRFVVSPKSDALLLGSAFGVVGDAVNAQISDTSGYFQIEMVP